MTTEQKECMLPFKYRERNFTECTTLNSEDGKPWCYIIGEDREFGTCSPSCPFKERNKNKYNMLLKRISPKKYLTNIFNDLY